MSGEHATVSILLTPPGTGAIGVVRVLGPDAEVVVGRLFRPAGSDDRPAAFDAGPCYGHLIDAGERIDDVIVSRAAHVDPPAVDLCVHGGIRVTERILESLARAGAGIREGDQPRPMLWHAKNRIEREACEALTTARTARAVRFLAHQRIALVPCLERITEACVGDVRRARSDLDRLVAGFRCARTLLAGATVALVGPPNAGKSTLFNRLLGRDTAVVSARPGTTRDWIAEPIEMRGVPLTLVDTAGGRAIPEGVGTLEESDLSLLILDGSAPVPPEYLEAWAAARGAESGIVVLNKCDLPIKGGNTGGRAPVAFRAQTEATAVSARTGEGVDTLVTRVLEHLGLGDWSDTKPCPFTKRQLERIGEIRTQLDRSPVTGARWIPERLIELS